MTGGLGNQLFIYAFYMQMCRHHPHTRIDLSDMRHYRVHNGYELHRIFPQLPQDELCLPQWVGKVMQALLCRTVLERHVLRRDAASLEPFFGPRRWPLVYFKGFYQSERYFSDIAPEVRQAFQFHPELASRQTQQLLARIDSDRHAVSLHVRRGDYLSPAVWRTTGQICQSAYYRQALESVMQADPEATVYVFSDEPQWVRDHLPLPAGTVCVDHNHGADSWQDMMLMSHCRHHVICNSTFSWWGAWLNPRPDKRVYAPSRWHTTQALPYICPPEWERIQV